MEGTGLVTDSVSLGYDENTTIRHSQDVKCVSPHTEEAGVPRLGTTQLRIRIPELCAEEELFADNEEELSTDNEEEPITPQYTPTPPLKVGEYVRVWKGELRDMEGVVTDVDDRIATVKIAYHQRKWVNAVYNEEGAVIMTRTGADQLPLEWDLRMKILEVKTRSPRHPTTPAPTPTYCAGFVASSGGYNGGVTPPYCPCSPAYGGATPAYGATPTTPAYGATTPTSPVYRPGTPAYGATTPTTPVYGVTTPTSPAYFVSTPPGTPPGTPPSVTSRAPIVKIQSLVRGFLFRISGWEQDLLEQLEREEKEEKRKQRQLRKKLEVAMTHMRRILAAEVQTREDAHGKVVTQCMEMNDQRVADMMYRLFVLLKEAEKRQRLFNEVDTTEIQAGGRSYKGLMTLKCLKDPVKPGLWEDDIEWESSPDGINPIAAYLGVCFYLDCCGGLNKENDEQLREFLNRTDIMFPDFESYRRGPESTGWRSRNTLVGVANQEVFTLAYNAWLRKRFPQTRRNDHMSRSTIRYAPSMPMIHGFHHSWDGEMARPASQVLYALSRYFKVVRVRGRQGGALDWAWWSGRRRGGNGKRIKEMEARHKMEKEMLLEENTRLGEHSDELQRQMMAQHQHIMAQQQQMMMMKQQMMAMQQRMMKMQRMGRR